MIRFAVPVLLVLAAVRPATAQTLPDPSEDARFRLGPVAWTPKAGVRNVGVDTNVFNAAQEPMRDITATFTGGADTWLRAGRAYFAGKTSVDWLYFQKASDQRSFNVNQEARVDVDLLRLVPRVGGSFINTRQRPNDEFDLRVQQRVVGGFAGVTVPIGTKLQVDLDAWRTRYDFSEGEFGNDQVALALNRESRVAAIAANLKLTPLTTFSVRAEARRDRFTATPDRNSESVRVMPGFKFEPTAIIAGSAFVGYRKFETASASVPEYGGLVAAMELRVVALDMIRVTGQFNRDVDYSLDLNESFYVSTSTGVEVMQALGLDWDVVGRLRRGALAYQQVGPTATSRTDRAVQVGVGLGRRLGTEIRLGIDVDYVTRHSVVAARAYDGFRFGSSVTYGY